MIETSFEQRVTAAYPMLLRFAISLTRDADRASDLVQDTMLKALANKDKFDGANLPAWLTTICKNALYSKVRKKTEAEDPEGFHQAGLADDSDNAETSSGEELGEVSKLINVLPEKQRLMLLDRADGLSYEQIAEKHKVEIGTVKSSINRARETLGLATEAPRNKRRVLALVGGKERFRKIDTTPFAKPPAFETELGERPKLLWLPLTRLFIDESYQRNVLERGVANVYHIVRHFDWKKFSAVVCAKVDDMYAIVDGQHRTYAAAIRGIDEIPCLVMEATTAEQAIAFAAINGRTTRIDELQVYHAAVVAGMPEETAIHKAITGIGVKICRYKSPEISLKPRETMAIGTIRMVYRLYGAKVLSTAFKCVLVRHHSDRAVLRAPVIRAMSDVVAELDELKPQELLERAGQVNFKNELMEAKIQSAQRNIAVRHVLLENLLRKFQA